jgi:hypothetical protein
MGKLRNELFRLYFANALWSLATLGWPVGEGTKSTLESLAVREESNMKSQDVSNAFWGLATLGWPIGEGTKSALERAAVRIAPTMTPQHVSNTLWAMATLGWPAANWSVIEANRLAPLMNSQDVSNSLWALGKLGVYPKVGGWSALAKAVAQCASIMSAQEVSNVMWAMAMFAQAQERHRENRKEKLGWADGSLQFAMEGAVEQVAPMMTAQHISVILWALATLGWQAQEGSMRSVLEKTVVREAPRMLPQNVATIMWSVASLAWSADWLRFALKGAVERVATSMIEQDVANVLWAMAAIGWRADANMAIVIQRLSASITLNCKQLHLSQLLQAHLASQYLGLGLVTLSPSILQLALKATREARQTNVTISNVQLDFRDTLNRLGIPHELEHTTADGLFSIDIAIADRRIAIEVDGPSHFTTNTLEPMGHTLLRDRLLSAMGWHVVSIPFFDWNDLRNDHDKDAYVDRRLHRVPGFSEPNEPIHCSEHKSPEVTHFPSHHPAGTALDSCLRYGRSKRCRDGIHVQIPRF